MPCHGAPQNRIYIEWQKKMVIARSPRRRTTWQSHQIASLRSQWHLLYPLIYVFHYSSLGTLKPYPWKLGVGKQFWKIILVKLFKLLDSNIWIIVKFWRLEFNNIFLFINHYKMMGDCHWCEITWNHCIYLTRPLQLWQKSNPFLSVSGRLLEKNITHPGLLQWDRP